MDPRMVPAGFIRQYLHVETAYAYMPVVLANVKRASWADGLRKMFDYVLEKRPLSHGEYCDLTSVDFESDDELYAYLRKVYDYLFLGSGEVPVPPD
ncbi:hypothetical protein [Streptomyces sp. NRRL B-24484]|uniref:hypothetical protein n=1 Tax=Streptomyces sp. NRRL B-24484 TaxID=1463833 RepID=UPI0004C155D2|nr:hypothetical protein [Streptomyces sp. NRRL B-24484]